MSGNEKILVLLPVTEAHKKQMEAAAPEADFIYRLPEALTREAVEEAHAVIGNIPAEWIGDCKNMKWLHLNFTGVGAYGEPGFLPEGVLLTNSTGAYGEAIGEYLVALLLSMMKKLSLYRDQQKLGVWQDLGPVRSIMGSRVLVAGLGDIGRAFARRISALGGHVIGLRRHPGDEPEYVEKVYALDQLDRLLPEADVIAMCLPDTPLTQGLITRERLLSMKKDAFFLNVGRGNVVDNLALAEILTSGHLAGAAMDVTEPEPLPEGHPLWTAPNMLITPHVAGQFHLDDILEKVVQVSCANLRRYIAGEALYNQVDKEAGYRREAGRWAP
ncbi:MAG: D-2-hydroxyacid dehydrogenase [Peptococcaceae bacterium]|nr:D-2-hydroxyacid dehydrogenase [Peptococcaceae bacterium]